MHPQAFTGDWSWVYTQWVKHKILIVAYWLICLLFPALRPVSRNFSSIDSFHLFFSSPTSNSNVYVNSLMRFFFWFGPCLMWYQTTLFILLYRMRLIVGTFAWLDSLGGLSKSESLRSYNKYIMHTKWIFRGLS